MRDFENMLEQRGMTRRGVRRSAIGVPSEALEADIAGQAEQAVKEELALEALFRAEGHGSHRRGHARGDRDHDRRRPRRRRRRCSQRWTENGPAADRPRADHAPQGAVRTWLHGERRRCTSRPSGTEAQASAAAAVETTEE